MPVKIAHILVFLQLFAGSAVAEATPTTRAVLVGVGDYLYLDADLQGPVNEVGLMADTLMLRGVDAAEITVLSDPSARTPTGVARHNPTRAMILTALDDALAASIQGDTIVFYFSGHGAQAPDINGDENGGMDEIFLPSDTRGWNGGTGIVENAIVDDEIGAFATRAAAKGVALIGILDACFSGTGFRAIEDDPQARGRFISPALLGLSEAEPSVSQAKPQIPKGDFVFMYAAQSDQRAFEYPVGDEQLWYGDFTRSLTAVLRDVPDLSYTQLVQAASARMQTKGGQATQTPDVEGPLADTAVLGGDAPGLRRIGISGQTMYAGLLDDVTVGSEIALFAGLTADTPVGRAQVTAVRATNADIAYIGDPPAVRISHGEVTNRAVDATVAFAFDPAAAALLPGTMDDLAARVDFDIRSVNPSHRIVPNGAGFAIVGRDGVLDGNGPGSSLRFGGTALENIALNLSNVAARLRLERALAQVSSTSDAQAFALLSSGPKVLFERVEGEFRAGKCRPQNAPMPIAQPHVQAAHCDRLVVNIKNLTAKMQDATVIYIDANSQISVLWPQRNLSNRIESGGEKQLRFELQNSSGADLYESVLVLSVAAAPGSARTRFSALGGSQQSRGANSPIGHFLTDLTNDTTSRGFSLKPKAAALSVTRLDLKIQP